MASNSWQRFLKTLSVKMSYTKKSGHISKRKASRRRVSLSLESLEDRAVPATFTVTNTLDDGSTGSLRWAVGQANSNAGPDTINFNLGSGAHTIVLNNGALTLADTSGKTTLSGPGTSLLTINGSNKDRLFFVNSGVNAEIDGLTLTQGFSDTGKAIYNAGTLTIYASNITNNSAVTSASGYTANYVRGGAIYNGNTGTLIVSNSTLSNNNAYGYSTYYSATGFGGAIFNDGGTVNVTGSTLNGNFAEGAGYGYSSYYDYYYGYYYSYPNTGSGSGGAIYSNGGFVTISSTTLSNNSAYGYGQGGGYGYGGAIDSAYGSTVTVSTSTLNGNYVYGNYSYGGAIYNNANLEVDGSTISGNSLNGQGGYGGAIYQDYYGSLTIRNGTLSGNTFLNNNGYGYGGALYLNNNQMPILVSTIVANNSVGTNGYAPNVSGNLNSGSSYNLIGDGTGMGGISNGVNFNQIGTSSTPIDPRLAPLGYYGGSTQTQALLPDSPALNEGSSDGFSTDQRGLPRVYGSAADIGAFEAQGYTMSVTQGSGQTTAPGTALPIQLQVQVKEGAAHPLPGIAVTFTAPTSGPSGTFNGSVTVTTASNGIATAPSFTANSQGGSYTVSATAAGGLSATFVLTNDRPPVSQAGGPYMIEYDSPVTLNGTGSFDPDTGDHIVSYAWDLNNDGQFTDAAGATPTLSWAQLQALGLGLGNHTIGLRVTDSYGLSSTATTTLAIVDTTPPTTTATLSGTAGTNGWYTGPVTVNLSATDTGSGVATTYYRIGSSGSFSIYNAAQPPGISADGSTTVYYYSVDGANNVESAHSIIVKLDQIVPQVSMTGPATNTYTNNNKPTLTASASDATSGVASVQFQITSDGTNWTTVSGTVSQNGSSYALQMPNALADGSYMTRAIATDSAGNSTTSTAVSFTVDTVPPGITNVSDVPDPFSPNGDGIKDSSTISYTLSEASNVTVTLSDASSNPVRTLLNSVAQTAGAQSVVWDGTNGSGAVVADGTYTYDVTATDAAGNKTDSVTLANTDHTVTVDNTPPTISITVEPSDPTNVNVVNFTFAGSDNFTSSANLVYQYSLDGVNYWTLPGNGNTLSLSGLADGRYTLSVRSVDEAGNVSAPTSYSWTVDTTAPKTTASVSGTQGNAGWYTGPATVTLSADDTNGSAGVSGVDQTYFIVDGGPQQTYTAPLKLSTDGQHDIVYWSVDKAGNQETPHQTLNVNIDQTSPTISGAPTTAANADGWYNGPVTIHFSAKDATPGSGLASVSADTILTGEGANQSVTGTSLDVAGNRSSTTVSGINIDLTPPTTTVTPNIAANANGWNNTDVTLAFAAADALSGVKATYYIVDGGATQTGTSLTLSQGVHTVEFWSVDQADNPEAHQTITVRIDETAPTISAGRVAGFEANANGWNNGMVAVSYTASDSLSGLPAGTETGGFVFLTEGADQSQTFTVTDLAGNSASATVSDINIDLTLPTISASATTADGNPYTPGTWTNQDVTVRYATSDTLSGIASSPIDQVFGEGDNQTATATVSDLAGNSVTASITGIDVDQTKPTVSVLNHPDSVTNDTSADFTFSGSDDLSDVDHLEYSLDGSNYTTGSSASFTNLADGNHTLYVRSIDHADNVSDPVRFGWVIDTTTTTSLSSSENASTYGDSVTFTATVSNAATTVNGGTVAFEDGNTVLDTENLDSTGHASFTLNTLNAGTHHFSAVFSGSTNGTEVFQSSSGNLDQQVNKANANIQVTPYAVTYDSTSHSAAGTATGVFNEDLSTGLDLTGTIHSNAGTYTGDTWSFHDAAGNYNDASGTIVDSIAKQDLYVTANANSKIYGQTATESGTITGVQGNDGITASFASTGDDAHAGVGTGSYSITATLSDPNNKLSNYSVHETDATLTVNKATASITLNPYSVTYDGSGHTASGSAKGVFNENLSSALTLSGTTHTNAGTYTGDAWSFHDAAGNYNDASGTVTDSIAKADATINVTPYSVIFDGNSHTATGTVTGVKGETLTGLNLSATTHTSAGTYASDNWTFADSTGNYNNATGSVSDSIAKATPTVSVTDAGGIYNGSAFPATASVAGVSGTPGSILENVTPTLTYYPGTYSLTNLPSGGSSTAPSAVGNYTVVASFAGSMDYNASRALANFSIADKFGGYLPPVSLNMNLVEGRTVPIKFQLTDASGNNITSTSGITLSISGPNGYSLSITSGNGLVYSSQFQYNWQTPKVAGSYTLSISSNGVLVPGSTKTLTIVAPGGSAAGLETDSSAGTSTAGALLGGEVDLYVDNSNGDLTSDELARVQDAVHVVQATVAPYGVTLIEVSDPTQSNVMFNMDTTTSLGGYAGGVLGCTTNGSQVTMVQGWNWYAGSDASGIGSDQFDFETAVIHELGHALGLGHSSDSTSVMYATLGTGTANRTLVTADLNVPDDDSGPCALHAVPTAALSSTNNNPSMTVPSSTSMPSGTSSASSGNSMSAADKLFANFSLVLNDMRNAYQRELSALTAMWQSADAVAMQHLDALLSMEAGAMRMSKDTLMRDLLFASPSSPNGV